MPVMLRSHAGAERLAVTDADRRDAQSVVSQAGDRSDWTLTIRVGGTARPLPRGLSDLLAQVVQVVAHEGSITIGTMPKELTTTVAAEQLGVSRPTLMRMIRDGKLPAHKVGAHTRLMTHDVLTWQRRDLEKKIQAFDRLRALEDELEMDVQ